MYNVYNEKRKRQITEGRERLNEEREGYKYLGILEADNIKRAEMEEITEKNISGEWPRFSKPCSAEGISSTGKTPGLFLS